MFKRIFGATARQRRRAVLAVSAVASLAAVAALSPLASRAQQNTAVITVAIPDNQHELYANTIIPDFEKANPNIIVQPVSETSPNVPTAATDVNNYLDAVQGLMSQADVLLINPNNVSAEGTRAGYFLNLQPLIDSDSSFNSADFFPSMLRAYQWDQGTWALPLSGDATILIYDQTAFDKAGLNYPTAQWTLDDLINAATKLTAKDSSGNITTPGLELFQGNNDIPLYMSLLGKPLYDPSTIPNPPNINQPEVQTLLMALPNLFAAVPAQAGTFGQSPIQITSIRGLLFRGGPNTGNARDTYAGVLLPGGHSYLNVSGVAVSSATQQPEAAYTFAKFLTTRPDVASRGFAFPARQSLVQQVTSGGGNAGGGPGGPGGGGGNPFSRLTADEQKLYQDAIANGYSTTDRRFFDFFQTAVTAVRTQNTDPGSAIATAQTNALQAETTALARKADSSKIAVVATPLPTLAANAGITLKFGVASFGPIPNKPAMQALADQFVKDNPGVVGRVDIEPVNGGGGPGAVTSAAQQFDAFYIPYNVVPNVALDSVINLDPYLSADQSYNANDFVGGVIAQVTRDNKIWALPMNIQPTVMWYDPVAFKTAALPNPASGWNISDFNTDLKGLAPTIQSGNPPFVAEADLGSSLLMLTAAYGGLPIDFRTNPPTINFTDKANVDAMQQVLDLAKNKLIEYQAMAGNFGFFFNGNADNPVYSQVLNGINFRGQRPGANGNAAAQNYTPITFPTGSQYQMMAYSTGTLYISATAQNADAAYKWISLFSQHPELTNAMPARLSQLNNSQMDATYGAALAQTYRDAGKILSDPNTISAPSLIGGFVNLQNVAVQHWLYQAWDNYVLKGQDLATGLAQAQQYAQGFLQCAANIPPFDPSQEQYSAYTTQILNCAVKVDPSVANLRGG